MTSYEYSPEDDIVFFKYGDYDEHDKTVEIGGYIIDFSVNGDFIGLEILDASEKIGLSREELEKVERVQTKVIEDGESKIVNITMELKSSKNTVNLPISSSMTGQPA